MEAIEIIRVIGKEFASVSDGELGVWIELCKPLVSKKQFGKLYDQALAYLVCHKMKVAGGGENPLGEEFNNIAAIGFSIGSVSEGGSSISFGASQGSNLANDAELTLTGYGLQFLTLRRLCIIPIHVSGRADQ